MKGIVFTEFIEMVEEKFGFEMADTIITNSSLPSGGAYTAVGTYHMDEMMQLVSNLCKETQIPVSDLLIFFGKHLFTRFVEIYPHFFKGMESAFNFLVNIEDYIHVEVLKLYPDAQLPQIDAHIADNNTMELTYRSDRKLSDLAFGLIQGCVDYFGGHMLVKKDMVNTDGSEVRFVIERK